MTELAIEEKNGAVRVALRVTPRASRDAIVGVYDGALKVTITAPPVDGAANAAIVRLLARTLGVAKGAVRIVGGESGRRKLVEIDGVSVASIRSLVRS
jgi:uncharacterized protein (TIGR00251 family)